MVLEIATALLGLAMTEVVVTWSHFAGVRRLSQIIPRNGHNRSLHIDVIIVRPGTPSGS